MANKRTIDPTKKMTRQQEKFCKHYAQYRNGAEAYRHAYPTSKKWKPQRVATEAQKTLALPHIARRIGNLAEKVAQIADEKFEISSEMVLRELATMAFQNSQDYFEWGIREVAVRRKNKETGKYEIMHDENGNPITEPVPYARIKPSEELSREQMGAVLSVSETITKTGDRMIEAKMGDKLGALKLLGQHLGLFKVRVETTGKDGGPIVQEHRIPDLANINDPKAALRAFEDFRLGAQGRPN